MLKNGPSRHYDAGGYLRAHGAISGAENYAVPTRHSDIGEMTQLRCGVLVLISGAILGAENYAVRRDVPILVRLRNFNAAFRFWRAVRTMTRNPSPTQRLPDCRIPPPTAHYSSAAAKNKADENKRADLLAPTAYKTAVATSHADGRRNDGVAAHLKRPHCLPDRALSPRLEKPARCSGTSSRA